MVTVTVFAKPENGKKLWDQTNMLKQVNRSKLFHQRNTGNGTAYILFRYQRTTTGGVAESE